MRLSSYLDALIQASECIIYDLSYATMVKILILVKNVVLAS